MNDLDANLQRLLRAAALPAPDVDVACAAFLRRVRRPRRYWIPSIVAALLLFAFILRAVVAPDLGLPAAQAEALVERLGHASLEEREKAAQAIRATAQALEHAGPEILAEAGVATAHADAPATEFLAEIVAARPEQAGRTLEVYDVFDLMLNGRHTGEDLAAALVASNADEWEGGSSIQYNDALLVVYARPASHPKIHDFLNGLRGPAPAGRHADPGVGRRFAALLAALEKAASTSDGELRLRATALAAELRAARERLGDHGYRRRAAIARIRAETGEPSPEGIRRAFEPCEAAEVKILKIFGDGLSEGLVRALREGDGIVGAIGPHPLRLSAELRLRGGDLLFTLPSRQDPPLVVQVKFKK